MALSGPLRLLRPRHLLCQSGLSRRSILPIRAIPERLRRRQILSGLSGLSIPSALCRQAYR